VGLHPDGWFGQARSIQLPLIPARQGSGLARCPSSPRQQSGLGAAFSLMRQHGTRSSPSCRRSLSWSGSCLEQQAGSQAGSGLASCPLTGLLSGAELPPAAPRAVLDAGSFVYPQPRRLQHACPVPAAPSPSCMRSRASAKAGRSDTSTLQTTFRSTPRYACTSTLRNAASSRHGDLRFGCLDGVGQALRGFRQGLKVADHAVLHQLRSVEYGRVLTRVRADARDRVAHELDQGKVGLRARLHGITALRPGAEPQGAGVAPEHPRSPRPPAGRGGLARPLPSRRGPAR